VAIAGAAGGVGSIAVQLARRTGATVLGIAAAASGRIDAFLDFFGGGYVAMAVEDLGVPPDRVDTIADFDAAKRFGVQTAGGADAATAAVVAELADLIARDALDVPIAGVFALDDVREAYGELELRHAHGKLVLRP
jgi:NADPH:quinone reductase-like Zn-dependent oxidoreductase